MTDFLILCQIDTQFSATQFFSKNFVSLQPVTQKFLHNNISILLLCHYKSEHFVFSKMNFHTILRLFFIIMELLFLNKFDVALFLIDCSFSQLYTENFL